MGPNALKFAVAAAAVLLAACTASHRRGSSPESEAAKALAAGDTSRAVRLYEEAVRADDPPAEAYVELSKLYRARGTIKHRVRAQKMLEGARHRDVTDPSLLYELGVTYREQGYDHYAEDCFKHILQRDWRFCAAHYQLGLLWLERWRRATVWSEYLSEARAHFKRAVACDSTHLDAFTKYAFGTYALEQDVNIGGVVAAMVRTHPQAPESHFMVGVLAYERAAFDTCWVAFQKALSLLDEEEREAYENISMLLIDDEEVIVYEGADAERRRSIRRAYWMAHDPDPTTEENELHLEHLYRMFLADNYFAHPRMKLRGWDTERGRVFVKFGKPTRTQTTLAGLFHEGRSETWQYWYGGTFFQVRFMDQFLNGNFIIPIDWKSDATILYYDPAQTRYESPAGLIPGLIDVVTFRDDDGSSSVYVTTRINVDTLDTYLDLGEDTRFVERTAFFDMDWLPEYGASDTIASSAVRERARAGRAWYHRVSRHRVPFADHQIALAFEDEAVTARAVLLAEASTKRFVGEALTMSDILLYTDPPDLGAEAFVERGENRFYPNPSRRYYEGQRLRLYLEAYNLDVSAAHAQYDVSYSIFEAPETEGRLGKVFRGLKRLAGFSDDPDPVISQTIAREAVGHESHEKLAIDINELGPGLYVLMVAISDRFSGESTSRAVYFEKSAGEPE